MALYVLDRVGQSRAYFSRAVELEPENPQYRADHARALIGIGMRRQAETELATARALGVDPDVLAELEALLGSADDS